MLSTQRSVPLHEKMQIIPFYFMLLNQISLPLSHTDCRLQNTVEDGVTTEPRKAQTVYRAYYRRFQKQITLLKEDIARKFHHIIPSLVKYSTNSSIH